MGFSCPWIHGYLPALSTVEGTALAYQRTQARDDTARMLAQFADKPRIRGLIRLNAGRWQWIEMASWSSLVERWLSTAIGAQLDVLGKLLGVGRGGRTDDLYRRRLRVEILVLRSSGSCDELIRIAALFLDDAGALCLEEFPAAGRFDLPAETDGASALELARLIQRAKVGGTRWLVVFAESAAAETFTFGDDADAPELDEGRGFGDVNDATIGGTLAGVFTGED